jgi:transcriptional regulator with XRE-family HTH domain
MAGDHMTAREFVGKEIRLAREAKGMSRLEPARRFPVSKSLVRWWESGRTVPAEQYVQQLVEILDLSEMIKRVLAEFVSKEIAAQRLGKWLMIEERSNTLLNSETMVIPGLMQTEDYARAVLRLGEDPFDLEEQVSERLARQHVLAREDPPLYHAIVDEAAIRRPVGGPKTMCDQLMHVVELAQRDTSIVQVIPFRVGAHAGVNGPVVLTSFDGAEVAYIDNALRGDVVEKPEDVAAIRRIWQKLSSKALLAEDSIEMIKEVASTWMT